MGRGEKTKGEGERKGERGRELGLGSGREQMLCVCGQFVNPLGSNTWIYQ